MKSDFKIYPIIKDGKFNYGDYKHLWWLIYWPIYGVSFWFVEKLFPATYHPVHSVLDDYIPFNEWFYIPYVWWFVYLVGTVAYTFFCDKECFRRLMKFVIFTYTVTIIVYLIYPTCQELRPTEFARENLLTYHVQAYYDYDTNTNVCPSLHVIGSLAAMFALIDTPKFKTPFWIVFNIVTAILICISTVFMKQHSILDVIYAIPLCTVGYFLFFFKKTKKE